jgi:hypothetical protein
MRSRFSEAEVLNIRTMRAPADKGGKAMTLLAIAEIYGSNQPTISGICAGETYKRFGGPITPRCAARYRNGRRSNAKLSDVQVIFLRELRHGEPGTDDKGVSLRVLAKMYGISKSGASEICAGTSYADVGGPRTKPHTVYADRPRVDKSTGRIHG